MSSAVDISSGGRSRFISNDVIIAAGARRLVFRVDGHFAAFGFSRPAASQLSHGIAQMTRGHNAPRLGGAAENAALVREVNTRK